MVFEPYASCWLTSSLGLDAGSASGSGGFGAFASQLATAGGSESAGGIFGSKPAFAFGSSAGAGASAPAQSVFGGSSAGVRLTLPLSWLPQIRLLLCKLKRCSLCPTLLPFLT